MQVQERIQQPLGHVVPFAPEAQPLADARFRDLLGAGWNRLPAAIKRRFGKRLKGGDSVAYQGVVTMMRMNRAGWVLAQLARLVGAPLPFDLSSVDRPAVVIVTEDAVTNGQFWIRQYGRASGFPQTVHSSKRFAHFFLQIAGRRFRLPRVLSPGALVIGHHDLGEGQFAFTLNLQHRLFGELISQDAVFRDAKE